MGGALAVAVRISGGGLVWLLLAGILVLGSVLVSVPTTRRRAGATAFLLLALVLGFAAQGDLHRFSAQWPDRLERWEEGVQEDLRNDLDALLTRAEAAADRVSGEWSQDRRDAGVELNAAFLPEGVDAVAAFDPGGTLLARGGVHQGPFPLEARFGDQRYLYREGALFGYLYVTHPLPEGQGTVVAASLLRADLPPGLDEGLEDFTSRFERERGAVIRVSREDRVEGESIWDLRWNDRILFSVTAEPLSEGDALDRRRLMWERGGAVAIFGGWLLLLLALRRHGWALAVPGLGLLGLLLLLPLGRLLAAPELFSAGGFLLPLGPALTLGDLLALAGGGLFLLGVAPPPPRFRWLGSPLPDSSLRGALLALALGAALLLLGLLGGGASRDLLAYSEGGWITFQTVAGLLVGLILTLGLLLSRRDEGETSIPYIVGALVAGLALAGFAAHQVYRGPQASIWLGLLWIIPLGLAARALPGRRHWTTGILGLVLGMGIAATLSLPLSWSLQVEARMAAAEARMERLGTRPDPFLEFLLLRAGEDAVALAGTGRNAVETLYGAWTRSGLAREDVPAWMTVWSPDGRPQEELRIGVSGPRPGIPLDLVQQAVMEGEVRLRRFDLADVHYAAVAPLSRGAVVSIIVPPRRSLAAPSPLGPLFSPARAEPDPLVLIPLLPGEAPGATDQVEWIRGDDGWQGELYLVYPDEVYHAHYILGLPGVGLLIARGTLLLLLAVGVATLLWGVGRRVGQGAQGGVEWIRPWLTSFRGKVTLTLFAFFLIPTLGFGTLAYQTLSAAAGRTAEALAERAVEEAASWYGEVGGAMDVLARRAGSDILLYENGELVAGSLQELVDLGLYQGWLPAATHHRMMVGEELMTSAPAALGGLEYVVAYRRIAGGQVLAAPAPLQAGATALRQRDVADLIGFAVVMGGGLSILLSLLVGRALTRPIQTLRVASERVGAGNMGVHLPEDRADEFGAVFGAFNRMVDRLGRTRRALIRSSRRTRAIMEEVATGVVALDPSGRVILANPRAEDLLGTALARSQPLPRSEDGEDLRSLLSAWVEGYMRDGLQEATTEFQAGDRRVRVRARRVSREGPPGGLVVSLEDVTDELRTERILAWGEMARQVAHEVKNPLTPIKLGVQHIRRAWFDGHPDFQQILERNAEAILGEIDRLAAIAAGFSRFGAPDGQVSQPLGPVDPVATVEDVLTLYQAGDGPVRFGMDAPRDVPPVQARQDELKEVVINLLENARAALPGGGRVVVELEEVEGECELRVRDTGAGIPPDLLPRIFEPHFSTRSGGSGLGLAIVRRLVESWGGRVWAESQAEEGTTMTLRIPRWIGEGVEGADERPFGA
jgi:two-component system, NtrC family, nitrogen regulation sensor histidine kinase NtrY